MQMFLERQPRTKTVSTSAHKAIDALEIWGTHKKLSPNSGVLRTKQMGEVCLQNIQ